jgi:hypothetical protein
VISRLDFHSLTRIATLGVRPEVVVTYRLVHFASRAVEPRTTWEPASERRPDLQMATRVGPLSALKRLPRADG